MSKPAMLADHLDRHTSEILSLWRTAVENVGDVPEAERLSGGEFVDHVPALLDRLAERLRGQPSDAGPEARKHGEQRWRQGYDIAEVVNEFGHLRSTLQRATVDYALENGWDIDQLASVQEVIHDVLDDAIAESVRQFQHDSDGETQKALAEVKKRQAAVEEAWVAAKLERAKFETILEHLPVAVWVVNADGTIVSINDQAERLQGYPRDETLGRRNVFHPEPWDEVFTLDGTCLAPTNRPSRRALRGEVVNQEELIWIVRGERRVVMVNAVPLSNFEGAIVGAVCVAQDSTRRREIEEEFRRQGDFFRTVTETVGEGLCTVDLNGRITFVNPAAIEHFGRSETELIGRDLQEIIHSRPPRGPEFTAEERPLRVVLRTGATIRGDKVFLRKDGSTFVASFTASPILSGGRIVGAVEVFRDITERNQLEASLAASESRFRVIAEKSPVMIWRTDDMGRCDYVNQIWLDFRNSSATHELGEGWLEGIHPDDRPRCDGLFRDAHQRREPFELTYRLLRHDGQYRWVSDRGTPYFDSEGRFLGYLGSCLDIHDRIELETALEQQRAVAEEASRHKTQLVSALSHDARTPLNAVVLAAQLLEIHIGDLHDPEVQESLRTIRHSVRNVLDLLGDLLNLSKIDAGASPAEVSRFPIAPCLAECLASIDLQARQKGLDARLELDALGEATVETDRSKLKQILCNLLSNALRYTEAGSIRISCHRTEDQLRIDVADTGVGIDPSDQPRIFEEFTILKDKRRKEGEGTGLGLAICRRLASLLKGEIQLQSAPGVGSTFTLVLPASVLTGGAPDAPPDTNHASPDLDHGAILIVEDHLDSRQTLSRVLRRMGYRVLEASNGRDALALAASERLLAILMDVNMPVMDGIEATLALRADERFKALPIFALTGDVTLVNQRRIGEAGVSGYLEKPVTLDALRMALGSVTHPPKS